MKITQEVRAYARARGLSDPGDAIRSGMEEKSLEFRSNAARVYRPG
jgi:phosphomethylpyrimidine synthase